MSKTLRILLLHNFSAIRGGADRYVLNLQSLLQKEGHEVFLFTAESDVGLVSPRIQNTFRYLYNRKAAKKLEAYLKGIRPDIAHCHNIYGHLTPSILPVLKEKKIPVLMTLHDWKLICPNHRLFTEGSLCERCKGGRYYNAIKHRCFHNSLGPSILGTVEAYAHGLFRSYEKQIDCFISPSEFLMRKFVEFGWESKRIQTIPHFVDVAASPAPMSPEGIVFLGELTAGKGVSLLLKALEKIRKPIPVQWLGNGDLLEECKKAAAKSHHRMSLPLFQNKREVYQAIQGALVTVLPSLWYENQPLSILESYSLGRAVVGSNHGGIAELIEDQKTGLVFEPGNPDSLAERIEELLENPKRTLEMGQSALKKAEENFSPEQHYERLLKLYGEYAR